MWNCFSLPPHTTAKQSVSGRCRGSREAGSLPRQAGRGPGLCSTATASEPHHSNTPRVKTKHKTPYLPGLYKKLKVKEEKNNVILGEEEEILLSPHNTRCVLPFDNVQRRRNSSMRPEAGTGQEGSRGPARRCRAALRLQTCIGTYYRCSFTGVYYNSVRGTETYATTAKKCKRYRKLICKNWQETNISRAQFPQSALPEDTWPPPPSPTASWGGGGQNRACNMGLRGSQWLRQTCHWQKYILPGGRGSCAKCIYNTLFTNVLLPIFIQNVVKNSHLVWPYYTKRNKSKNIFLKSSV